MVMMVVFCDMNFKSDVLHFIILKKKVFCIGQIKLIKDKKML